ncbi:hypothetical protein CYLTODRAFT_412364 [Cylindrobasidium torrendii FP15055 ss-10]|uniref:Uncharacterized protein n=1 Tax=Cylindrobasidium torrendii FP15055 ss-10 TaxID=1314674 RepID=A0A0D7B8B3_9AGAR|nr:hypothetical protein CYLTODRAFT_412364 [Cylindrobasidium torrendii FP15055 ss-10]
MIPHPGPLPAQHAVVSVLARANNSAGTHFANGILWSQRRHYDDFDYAIPDARYRDIEEAILDAVMYVAGHLTVVPDAEGKDYTVVIETCSTQVYRLLTTVYLELVQVSPFPTTWPGVPAHHILILRYIHEMFTRMRRIRGTNVLYRLRSMSNSTLWLLNGPNIHGPAASQRDSTFTRFKGVTESALLEEIIGVVERLGPLPSEALGRYDIQLAAVRRRLSWLAKVETSTNTSSDGRGKGVPPTAAVLHVKPTHAPLPQEISRIRKETKNVVPTTSGRPSRRPEVSTLASPCAISHSRKSVPSLSVPSRPSRHPASEQSLPIRDTAPTKSYYRTPDERQTAASHCLEKWNEKRRVLASARELKSDAQKSVRVKKPKVKFTSGVDSEETPHLRRSGRTAYKTKAKADEAPPTSSSSERVRHLVPTPAQAAPIKEIVGRLVYAQFNHRTSLSTSTASKGAADGPDSAGTSATDNGAKEGKRPSTAAVRGKKRKLADEDETNGTGVASVREGHPVHPHSKDDGHSYSALIQTPGSRQTSILLTPDEERICLPPRLCVPASESPGGVPEETIEMMIRDHRIWPAA